MIITTLSAIVSVALIEIMLSVDNALLNASLAKKLPHDIQKRAMYFGITVGAIFRIAGLALATLLISYPAVKIVSALYLFWLAYEHLFLTKKEHWKNHPVTSVHAVLIQICLANLIFSIDNIVGVVGVSPHYSYLIAGVLLGVVALLFITPVVLRLMHQFPSLEKTTYILLTYIGVVILLEALFSIAVPEYITFTFIVTAMLLTMWHDKKKLFSR